MRLSEIDPTKEVLEYLTRGDSDWVRTCGSLDDHLLAKRIKQSWLNDLPDLKDMANDWPAVYSKVFTAFIDEVDWSKVVKAIRYRYQ